MNQRSVSGFFLFVLLFTLGCQSEDVVDESITSSLSTVYIKRVEDGDTVLAEVKEQVVMVRLIGIDSPELAGKHISKTQPYAQDAKNFLKKLIEKKWVKMEGAEHDKHGRLLVTLYLGSEDVNLKMVSVGLAEVYPGFSRAEYLEAQNNARTHRLNLWQSPGRTSPINWRKQYKLKPQP